MPRRSELPASARVSAYGTSGIDGIGLLGWSTLKASHMAGIWPAIRDAISNMAGFQWFRVRVYEPVLFLEIEPVGALPNLDTGVL